MLQLRKDLSPRRRYEPVPRSCDIRQFVAVIVADDQRVKSVGSGKITADDELLPPIHAIFDPGAAPLSRLVVAVLLFSDRKSTRLNSSHRCISYAVFCLKKK